MLLGSPAFFVGLHSIVFSTASFRNNRRGMTTASRRWEKHSLYSPLSLAPSARARDQGKWRETGPWREVTMGIDHYYCMGQGIGGGTKWGSSSVPSLPFHCSVAFLPWKTEIIVGTKDQEGNSGEGEGDYRGRKEKCEGQTWTRIIGKEVFSLPLQVLNAQCFLG